MSTQPCTMSGRQWKATSPMITPLSFSTVRIERRGSECPSPTKASAKAVQTSRVVSGRALRTSG